MIIIKIVNVFFGVCAFNLVWFFNFCQAGVEEEEEKWRQIVEEKDEEIQRTRSALSQAQVEKQADLVR